MVYVFGLSNSKFRDLSFIEIQSEFKNVVKNDNWIYFRCNFSKKPHKKFT